MRVLQIVDSLGMGGAETWLMEVLRHIRKTSAPGPQIDFLATSGKPGIFDEEARALGAKVHYVRFGREHVTRFTHEFRRILGRGGYGAIHDHQAYASGWHFLMGTGLLPPVRVAHVHNPVYQVEVQSAVRRTLNRVGARLIGHYATHIAGTSQQLLDEYGFTSPQFASLQKRPVYCGFDLIRFARDREADRAAVRDEFGWPRAARIILFAGRLDQSADVGDPLNHKNSGFAVAVAIEAARRDRRLRFVFAGQASPALPTLEARIAAAGMTDRFVFTGIRNDIERLMSASDALLFPSRQEGLGMVVVEAQAANLPVLASSAVPQESVVAAELVRFRDLASPVEDWASDLLQLLDAGDLVDGASKVANSHFAISHSVESLSRLYGYQRAA